MIERKNLHASADSATNYNIIIPSTASNGSIISWRKLRYSVSETSEKQKNGEKQVTNGNLTLIQMPIDSCPKKMMFDPRSVHAKSHPKCSHKLTKHRLAGI